jgi:hypothetical protein
MIIVEHLNVHQKFIHICWVLQLYLILNYTPQEEIHWCLMQRLQYPLSGSLLSSHPWQDESHLKMTIVYKVYRYSILHEVQVFCGAVGQASH